MHFDVVTLSRLQFALTIMFHYLFPPLTIGVSIVIVFLEAQYLWTKDLIYETAARFWTQLFAVTFAIGVATGIVMEFQFGTNWAVYSRFVGDVFGSALAAEGIFAFFLESGFLAILVFGWDKVGPKFHFFAALMVSLGSMFSSVWIIVANSWQQTPAGHHIVQMMRDGKPWFDDAGHPVMRAEVADFWAVVFNPSTIDRLVHTLIGAFLMGTFFVMSISAYYILRKRHHEFAKRSFTGALLLATFFSVAQLVSGDINGRMVAKQQPAKLAAIEAHFRYEAADLTIVGVPDVALKTVHDEIAIPGMLSFLVCGNWHTPLIGLDEVPRQYWPPVAPAFYAYHIMVGIGMFFIALTLLACFLRWRGTLFSQRWLLGIFVGAVILAVAANQLGWVTAELGRQPWVVFPETVRNAAGDPVFDSQGFIQYRVETGLLTSHAVSESINSGQVISSIILFGLIYALLFLVWLSVLNSKVHNGPEAVVPPGQTTGESLASTLEKLVDHSGSLSDAKAESAD
jgi:cytochrome d ubiquinol oxidase subunit I